MPESSLGFVEGNLSQFDTRALRTALGCFVTGVTIVTAVGAHGKAVGVTANSFASVSLDPPLVLWSIGRQSATFEVFSRTDAFVISVLGASGVDAARHFSLKGTHHVDEIPTLPTPLGPPAFAEALAVFECETHARHDGGDHLLLVGRVLRFSYVPDPDRLEAPLVYFRGRYGRARDLSG